MQRNKGRRAARGVAPKLSGLHIIEKADDRLTNLTAKIDAAKRALAAAASAESEALSQEEEARKRASDAVEARAVAGNELLTLSRDGHRGTIWTFAPGTIDNLHITWTDFEYAAAKLTDSVRRALVHDAVDGDDLLTYLRMAPYAAHWTSSTRSGAEARVVQLKELVGADGCRALRCAVDAKRDRTSGTVDHFAQVRMCLSCALQP